MKCTQMARQIVSKVLVVQTCGPKFIFYSTLVEAGYGYICLEFQFWGAGREVRSEGSLASNFN